MLPLAERAVAAVACTMHHTIGVESSELVETNLLGRMLPTEDPAALSTMVAALEETEWLLTRRRGAHWSGAVCLMKIVSTTGLELLQCEDQSQTETGERPPCIG
jgi:sialic acid synthase SpsE